MSLNHKVTRLSRLSMVPFVDYATPQMTDDHNKVKGKHTTLGR
jgi:hypothetical protein